jgi:signal transduction histidine kinase/tetratricopeptide (TPR) repeat protein
MNLLPQPALRITFDECAGMLCLDEAWLEKLEWIGIDHCAELSRWQVRHGTAQRRWLIIRASRQASPWELARLDREYAIGPTLRAAWAVVPLERLHTGSGPLLVLDDDGGYPLSHFTVASLSVEGFLQLAIAATQALGMAHQHGLIHCDIRPDNLILSPDGDIRLTGFAFAQAIDNLGANALPLADASLAYLAPELHGRQDQATPQSDLYALGVTFYRLLTGNLPFNASDSVQWLHQHMALTAPPASKGRAGLPLALDNLLDRLLAKQPDQRPASAALLEAELTRCLNEWRGAGWIPASPTRSPRPNVGVWVARKDGLKGLHQTLGRLAQGTDSATALTALDSPALGEWARSVVLRQVNALILSAEYGNANDRIDTLLAYTTEPLQRAELYRLKAEIHSLRGDYAGAVCTAIDGLAGLGMVLASTPTDDQVQAAWRALQVALKGRSPDVFMTLPTIRDARHQTLLELLAIMVIPGSFIHPHLMLITTCQIVTLTLQQGMSAAGVHALAWLGVASAHRFNAYSDGFDYAATARKLVERPCYASSKVSVLLALDQVSVWTRPLPFALECAESAFRESILQHSPSFACYANNHIVSNLLVLGAPIERMLRQIDIGLVMASNLEFVDAQVILYAQARYIRRLAGDVTGTIAIPESAELALRVSRSRMGPLRFWWSLYEGLLCYLDGSFELAAGHFEAAWALTWSAPAHIHHIDLALFSVLNQAALQALTGEPRSVERPMRHLRLWAESNPRYFADRLALAEAELLHLEGRSLEALQRYEAAIGHAQNCGATHLLGLSHTLAGRCHGALGLRSSHHLHLRKAHAAWHRWGAMALAQRLEADHDFLRERPTAHVQGNALSASRQLDVLSITRACQALSREIEPDALIKTLLTNAVTYAGATYAALMLDVAGNLRIEATGRSRNDGIDIALGRALPTPHRVPLSLISRVQREHESLLINVSDALRSCSDDPYLTRLESGSIMCLPLLRQGEAIGVLYLENALTPNAFEPSRIGVLELLAAQAAISLNTARLYADVLAENRHRRISECALRRTQALLAIGREVSNYGTFVWAPQTERSFWSARLIAELGLALPADTRYQRDPAMLVHAEDRLRFAQSLADAGTRLVAFRLEFRTIVIDGMPRHLELAGEPYGNDALIGVVSDITERRQTEIALRTARAELDRTSQATILGELAASIAHEVNQPLASILSNAGASIRWLQRPQPQIGDAIEGIQDILAAGQRAADIIRAMRALAQQAPLERKPVGMNQVIRQVLAITHFDLNDKQVRVNLKLSPTAYVCGDSIQLQQVMRNLIVNAVEAMQTLPAGSRLLTLQSQPFGRDLLVIVEDSGPGVPADKLASVFQTFYSTKPSGMGMGLAICSSIVSTHGGFLGCTQGRSGENLFFFTLPVQPS